MSDPRIEASALEVAADTLAACWHESSNPLDDARQTVTAYLAAADKAATITAVEGMEALPIGSVVLDRFNYPHHKYAQSKPDFKNLRTGHHITRSEFYLPARVIHFGGSDV